MADQKTPEQIAAEQKLQADMKKAKAEALEEKKKLAGEVHFVHKGQVYKPLIPVMIIPGLGKRTALEICADAEAQEYLIKEKCIGSVIEKI